MGSAHEWHALLGLLLTLSAISLPTPLPFAHALSGETPWGQRPPAGAASQGQGHLTGGDDAPPADPSSCAARQEDPPAFAPSTEAPLISDAAADAWEDAMMQHQLRQTGLPFGQVSMEPLDVTSALADLVRWLSDHGALGTGGDGAPNVEAYVMEDMAGSRAGTGSVHSHAATASPACASEGSRASDPSSHASFSRPAIGIRAARALQEGGKVLLVPTVFLVSADKVARHEPELLPYDIEDASLAWQWTSYTVLAAWILRERAKGEGSFFHPYLRLLPAYVPSPMLLSRSTLGLVLDQDLREKIESARGIFLQEFSRCSKAAIANALLSELTWAMLMVESARGIFLQEFSRCSKAAIANASFSEFTWAMIMVCSRCIGSEGSDHPELNSNSTSTQDPKDRSTEPDPGDSTAPASSEKDPDGQSGASEGGDSLAEGGEGKRGQQESQPDLHASAFHSPVMLVPYMDLINHHNSDNVAWRPEDGNFILKAEQNVTAGTELVVDYASKSTEDFLLYYGFVPSLNPHAHIPLFHSQSALISHFAHLTHPTVDAHSLVEPGFWAADVARKAEAAVMEELEGNQWDGLWEQHPTLAAGRMISLHMAWGGARAEPRMLAVLGGLWHSWSSNGTELDYAALAKASVLYGFQVEETNCSAVASWAPHGVAEALGMAAQMVRKRAQELLRGFTSTLEQDRQRVEALGACKESTAQQTEICGNAQWTEHAPFKSLDEFPFMCHPFLQKQKEGFEQLLRLQVFKKTLLQVLIDHLAWTCDPAYEQFRRAILYGEEFPENGFETDS